MNLRHTLLVLAACSASVVVSAQTTLLNDPLVSPPVGSWDNSVPAGAPAAGNGSLTFTGGGLVYTANTPTAQDTGYRTLISTAAPSTYDWVARVNVNLEAFNSSTLTNGQWANLNLHVVHVNSSGTPVASGNNSTFAIDRYTDGGTVTRGLEVYLPGGSGSPLYTEPTSTTAATLRITYSASAKTLSYFYDPDGAANGYAFTQVGSTTSLSSYGWSIAPTDNFAFLLIGGSGTNGVGVGPSLNGSGSYFTDFSLVAIPEPGTYALIGGLAALGLAVWRRRRAVAG